MPAVFCLVSVVALAAYILQRRRGGSSATKHGTQIQLVDANSAICNDDATSMEFSAILISLQPARDTQSPLVQFNQEDETWEGAQNRLSCLYKYRSVKTAFLHVPPEIGTQYTSDIVNIMQTAGIKRVCVVNSDKPPSWLTQRRVGAG